MAGISPDGFEIKRLPEIKSEMEELARLAIGSDATLLPDSPEGQIISIFSEVYADLWEQLNEAYNAFNPIAVTGQSLDNLVFLNGLSRLAPAPSTVVLAITGTDNAIVPAGSIIKHNGTGVEFKTTNSVEIGVGFPSGTATVLAAASKNGAIEALAGTLTDIATPVNGWATVINDTDADLGRNAETDAELRGRRDRSLTISGSASLETIIAEVGRIAGVSHAGGVENFTDSVDGFGLPPHSFEIVVEGGADEPIGQAIWSKKAAGIDPHGDINVGVIDVFGDNHIMKFSRASPITMYLTADVAFLGTAPADDGSGNGGPEEILTKAILDFVSGELIAGEDLGIGDDVVPSRLYLPFNLSYSNIIVNSLVISINGIDFDASVQAIEYNEVSTWAESRIVLTGL